MNEYISKEFMLKNLEDDKMNNAEHCEPVTIQIMERFIRYVKEFPAADVKPVKHGLWKGYITSAFYGCDDEGEPIYRDANFNVCSECGRKTVVKEKFCPNCGAKMDGGEK